MFGKPSIGKKLFAIFFTLSVITFFIGYSSSLNIKNNIRLFEEITSGTTPRIQALLEMKNISNEIAHNAHDIQIVNEEHTEEEKGSASDSKSLILADLEHLLRWIDEYRKASNDDNQQRLEFIASIEKSKSEIIAATLSYVDAKELRVGDEIVLQKELTLNTEITTLKRMVENALVLETENLRLQKQDAEEGMRRLLLTIVGMSAASVCLAVMAWFTLVRLIVRPLRNLRDATQAIAGGNMENTINIKSKDEIGDLAKSFNNMTERLRESRAVLLSSNDELEEIKKEIEKKLEETEKMNTHMINREVKMVELKAEIATLEEKVRSLAPTQTV